MATGKRRIKLGDVYRIPLPDGRYAFGRVFEDGAIGIYRHISDKAEEVPPSEDYQFIVGVYRDVLQDGEWPFVENRPFPDEEAAWPPPTFIRDAISGKFRLYHKGVMRKATLEECQGLERTAVWGRNHIVDRVMGDDKWHRQDAADLAGEPLKRPL